MNWQLSRKENSLYCLVGKSRSASRKLKVTGSMHIQTKIKKTNKQKNKNKTLHSKDNTSASWICGRYLLRVMTKILESISTKFACVDFLPQSQKYARVSLCCYVMESTFCPLATEDVQLHKRWCVSQHAHLSCKLCTDGMRFVRTKIIFLRNCENASFYRNC